MFLRTFKNDYGQKIEAFVFLNTEFRVYDKKVLNFVAFLGPILSGGMNLNIASANCKAEKLALLACFVGKVRWLEINCNMGFAEFFLIKKLFMKDATYIHLSDNVNKEVSS